VARPSRALLYCSLKNGHKRMRELDTRPRETAHLSLRPAPPQATPHPATTAAPWHPNARDRPEPRAHSTPQPLAPAAGFTKRDSLTGRSRGGRISLLGYRHPRRRLQRLMPARRQVSLRVPETTCFSPRTRPLGRGPVGLAISPARRAKEVAGSIRPSSRCGANGGVGVDDPHAFAVTTRTSADLGPCWS
jgi:hypothetical protein